MGGATGYTLRRAIISGGPYFDVETVTTADVFEGAEGALASSEPEAVAIGAMVVNGVSSIGLASCWLTF